jgi:hypothetical protein
MSLETQMHPNGILTLIASHHDERHGNTSDGHDHVHGNHPHGRCVVLAIVRQGYACHGCRCWVSGQGCHCCICVVASRRGTPY